LVAVAAHDSGHRQRTGAHCAPALAIDANWGLGSPVAPERGSVAGPWKHGLSCVEFSEHPNQDAPMKPHAPHAASYYAASSAPQPDYPQLEREHSCDVCIVGGGYSGLNTAIELTERGFTVTLLEAHKIGWGASGRNGGQL